MKWKKWVEEIKTVGLADWAWFVIWLKREKHHKRVNMHKYCKLNYSRGMKRLIKDRRRACVIDSKLNKLGE